MARAWIKIPANPWSDPRVSRLCDLTGKGKAGVAGAPYWPWATAGGHTRSARMPGAGLAGIDALKQCLLACMATLLVSAQ
ncbi:hypothetical protein LXA47_10325 [Massilia sp. P8910]|uniref:hypothetical protein n=1 Tax=Massilia antarctica TaxID=2765360 RepID=UPI001E2A5B92|nr:hypothetical protein [Massilia antarctica]MCE3603998.1 hypothetical protein [Massilia antarctica]